MSAGEAELKERVMVLRNRMPSEEDLKGAADALLRLQDTYKLSTKKIADGTMHPNTTSPPLTAEECFALGVHSYDSKDIYHTRLWMQEALDRLDSESKNRTVDKEDRVSVLDYLSYAAYKQGQLMSALTLTNELLTLVPDHERAVSNKIYFEQELAKERSNNSRRGDDASSSDDETAIHNRPSNYDRGEEFSVYEALCRNEAVIPDHNAHLLYCDYYTPHPFYYIGPVKQEVAFYKPRIVLWYDVLHDDENAEIRKLATPKLNRATVQNSITGELEFARYRISKSSWLPYSYSEVTERINDRIEALTGIDISTAEDLQVVNYGLAGQYEPHFDFARMSDVDAGGATVFTRVGARMWPRRNAAVFWWNLYPNGNGDLMTRHAACPVLAGSKWVMNKWFHERGQEFRRPCKLNRHAL